MVAAPIDHVAMSHFYYALQMPLLSNHNYCLNKRLYVQPVIKELYLEQQKEVLAVVDNEPLKLAIDGQFDSPGYSSELCRVTALDIATNLVVSFAVSHKEEVGGVSNRMELHGVKKLLKDLGEKGILIDSVTIDKNLGVMKYLREAGIVYHFDLWHLLKQLCKNIRADVKKLAGEEEQKQMRSLQRRLFTTSGARESSPRRTQYASRSSSSPSSRMSSAPTSGLFLPSSLL
jgi:hypothetical protein